jgi:hypothetical protein
MTHEETMVTIRELRALGAVYVAAGDVRVWFPAGGEAPAATAMPSELKKVLAELDVPDADPEANEDKDDAPPPPPPDGRIPRGVFGRKDLYAGRGVPVLKNHKEGGL